MHQAAWIILLYKLSQAAEAARALDLLWSSELTGSQILTVFQLASCRLVLSGDQKQVALNCNMHLAEAICILALHLLNCHQGLDCDDDPEAGSMASLSQAAQPRLGLRCKLR